MSVGMRCLVNSLILSVSADSSHANFPITNVEDGHPLSVWKANGADTATITCEVSGGADAFGVAGTNADSAAVTISDLNEVYFGEYEMSGGGTADSYFGEYEMSGGGTADSYFVTMEENVEIIILASGGSKVIAGTFTKIPFPIEIKIKLAVGTGTVIEAGQVEVGSSKYVSKNPKAGGLDESGESYSLKKILSSGARWTLKRHNVRIFSGQVQVLREDDFYIFMNDIAREIDIEPRFWWVTNLSGTNWLIFAELYDWPSGSHLYLHDSVIYFSLIEVL